MQIQTGKSKSVEVNFVINATNTMIGKVIGYNYGKKPFTNDFIVSIEWLEDKTISRVPSKQLEKIGKGFWQILPTKIEDEEEFKNPTTEKEHNELIKNLILFIIRGEFDYMKIKNGISTFTITHVLNQKMKTFENYDISFNNIGNDWKSIIGHEKDGMYQAYLNHTKF